MFQRYFLKLEKIFFYFFLFCLPFETRLIIKEWGKEFNEWNSSFLYLTDLLIFAIFFFWALRIVKGIRTTNLSKDPKIITLGILFLVATVSLFFAKNLEIGIYQLIKFAEFIILFFYIKSSFQELFNWRLASGVLIASALFQVFLGICQFALQHDLNLKIFGESPLGSNIEGVAKIVVSGVKMIRAYGTFPHPNVLAAFLLFSIISFYFFSLRREKASFGFNLVLASTFFFLVFGLFLTFSRTIIFLFVFISVLIFLFLFFKKEFYRDYRRKTLYLCGIFLLATILCGSFMARELYSRFVIFGVDPTINLRYFYNSIGLSIIKESSLFGTGLGNFVWRLQDFQGSLRAANLIYKLDMPETQVVPYRAPAWLFQPVHNIFLLIASEIGIFGLLAFLIFLCFMILPFLRALKENNLLFIFYFLFFGFLAVFFTDHFFWTLQQGRLMFWVLCGILAVRRH